MRVSEVPYPAMLTGGVERTALAQPPELSKTFVPAKGNLSAPDNRNLPQNQYKSAQRERGSKMLFTDEKILLRKGPTGSTSRLKEALNFILISATQFVQCLSSTSIYLRILISAWLLWGSNARRRARAFHSPT